MSVWKRVMFKTEGGEVVPLSEPLLEPVKMFGDQIEVNKAASTYIKKKYKNPKRRAEQTRAANRRYYWKNKGKKVPTFAEKIYNINENSKEFTDILKFWEVLFPEEDMPFGVVMRILKIQMLLREAKS